MIMEHLTQYVPAVGDQVQPILCSGDGLSVERMVSAHKARANGDTHEDRLDGLVESPQEFHKEILLLQVNVLNAVQLFSFNLLFIFEGQDLVKKTL